MKLIYFTTVELMKTRNENFTSFKIFLMLHFTVGNIDLNVIHNFKSLKTIILSQFIDK